MAEPIKMNLVKDLQRIHRVVTRSARVALDSSAEFARQGFPDGMTREGFYNYLHSLSSLLYSHHSGEDAIAFPLIRMRMPAAPVDELSVHHEKMSRILERIDGLLEKAKTGADDPEVLAGLNEELEQLNPLWNSHIQIEEEVFSPMQLDPVFQAEEQSELSQKLTEHGMKSSGPEYLVLPFILYNLSAEDRAELAQEVPPVITQELIPIVWKDQWASMKPFFLN